MARLLLDVRRRPDRMEGSVEAEPRIDVPGKAFRGGDDRLQGRAHEGVAMGLGPGQRAGVAADKGKMRREFLAKRHRDATPSKRHGPIEWTPARLQPATVA